MLNRTLTWLIWQECWDRGSGSNVCHGWVCGRGTAWAKHMHHALSGTWSPTRQGKSTTHTYQNEEPELSCRGPVSRGLMLQWVIQDQLFIDQLFSRTLFLNCFPRNICCGASAVLRATGSVSVLERSAAFRFQHNWKAGSMRAWVFHLLLLPEPSECWQDTWRRCPANMCWLN